MRLIRFNRQASSVGPLQDLRNVLRIRHRYQVWFMLAAAAVTGLVLLGFYLDSYMERPYKREIIYVESWRADRSLEEILAKQKVDEEIRLKREAELKEKAEKRRQEFKKIDDRLKAVGI